MPHMFAGHDQYWSDFRARDPEHAHTIACQLHMAVYTGSGYNVIRLRDLSHGWEQYWIPDAPMPPLGDANGNRLRLLGKVALRVRF